MKVLWMQIEKKKAFLGEKVPKTVKNYNEIQTDK